MNLKPPFYHKRIWPVAAFAAAFGTTLAILVGSRLSGDALGVLAGAACGVIAAVPTSLAIVAITRRQETKTQPHTPVNGAYPPVVVIAPPGAQQQQLPPLQSDLWPRPAPPREFTIVGDEYE